MTKPKIFPITRSQREAVWEVFQRDNPDMVRPNKLGIVSFVDIGTTVYVQVPTTQYRDFRRKAMPTIGCDGAIALPWAGMVLCIEKNGYIHS